MSNSTTQLDLISSSQAQKEVTANALFDAASPAMTYARRGSTTTALTWGFYGGTVLVAGEPTQVANGTVSLTASATNYVEANPADGTVSANTTGFTTGRLPLYEVVAGASTVISYTDLRILGGGAAGISAEELDDAIADGIAAHIAASDPHTQYQKESEKGAANGYAGLGSDGKVPAAQLPASATSGGTVTSVALTTPGLLFDVSGSPVTGAGTLAMALKTQAANKFLAGPTSGGDALPTMRAITQADLPAQPFDVHAFYPGIPTASAKVTRIPIARAVSFPANFAGSYFTASVGAAGTTVFDVQKNGASIGSISIAAGGTTATFTTTSGAAKTFAAGDVLSIIAPTTPDATLADVGFVLAGTR